MRNLNNCVIWWVRKDIRLKDNPTLVRAAQLGQVIPVYILDETSLELRNGSFRGFLTSALRSLDTELKKYGSGLNVVAGLTAVEIPRLALEFQCTVFTQDDFTPEIRRTFKNLSSQVDLVLVDGATALHPAALLKDDGSPYKFFSSYRKKWMEDYRSKVQNVDPSSISFSNRHIVESKFDPPYSTDRHVSERSALSRFIKFKSESGALWKYGTNRSRVDLQSSSGLSPYLNLGLVSANSLLDETFVLLQDSELDQGSRESIISWQSELIWREFFISALFHFPETQSQNFNKSLRGIDWNESEEVFERWKQGQTGYPIVDAAMRQLWQEGWIHNRLRMIVASFLVKDLLIDWRKGADWFAQTLVDIDEAANVGGWQWTAGTGLDAAPYFRVFNPVTQGEKFDPFGEYVREWVPELSNFSDKYVHKPWVIAEHRTRPNMIGSYPTPIVDHKAARQFALEAFKKSRSLAVE